MSHDQGSRLAVVVNLWVKSGYEKEFLDLLAPVLDAMRLEPTFINAALHQDPEDPTRFMLYETWADRTDLVEVQMKRRLPQRLRGAPARTLARAPPSRGMAAATWRLQILRRVTALI